MAKAAARKAPAGFLPHGAAPALRRLGSQALGLLSIALGLALIAALVTYDPRDPSLNTAAVGGAVANALGRAGAYGADAFLQLLGLAAWLPSFALIVWGARLIVAGDKPERLWLRVGLLISGALLLDIGLARLPIPLHSFVPDALGGAAPTLGGVAGRLLLSGLVEAAGLIRAPVVAPILALVAALLGLVCLNYAFGISSRGWSRVGRGTWTASRLFGRGLGWVGAASITTGGRALAATKARA
ncbi:MAG: DNA translocase FtsK 4TM domain-containing protein, partial [Pseudolabrys sp.]